MSFLTRLFGDPNAREIQKFSTTIAQIGTIGQELEALDDAALRSRFGTLKARVQSTDEPRRAQLLDELLPEVFAIVREVSQRQLGMRHFDEQLIGGIVLHRGMIAEMRTGEGKTLVATLPLVLNALAGCGAHLVTPNEYLAKVGLTWMGPIYSALGLTAAAMGQQGQSWQYVPIAEQSDELRATLHEDWPTLVPISRRAAYAADITYGTNNEIGFDYLRDNMALTPEQLVQRPLHYAIVDEVDSILIDEARTPLIISGAAEESGELYAKFSAFVSKLREDEDYTVNEKERHVGLTDEGVAKMERALGVENIYDPNTVQYVHHLEEALKAKALFKRDRDYVVRDDEVVIVDEFTGRLMVGRRYSEGLHQAIEAKEGVPVKQESKTLATITFQNLFRMYSKLAGMTGTAETEAEEFAKIYNLEVLAIPTHRPVVRVDHADVIYKTEAAKFRAIAAEVRRLRDAGRPVLVGTASIAKSEQLSKLLKAEGIAHDVLNAKQHEREAKIIEAAGEPGRVTVATNMAGRGVDILLGGRKPGADATKADVTAWEERHRMVIEAGGLAVIGSERHESRRIDNQLRGRAGRQGDPGSSQFYISMEDDLMRIFGGARLKAVMDRLGLPDDEPIQHKIVSNSIEQAQRRVEGHNFDIRKHLVEYDDVMNAQREVVYRKRHRILELDAEQDTWLHEEIRDLLHEDEHGAFDAKVREVGEVNFRKLERLIYLRTIDTLWVEHLSTMQHLRDGIGLRGYAQKDPLVEYKDTAYGLFQALKDEIENQVVEMLLRLEVKQAVPEVAVQSPQVVLQGPSEANPGGFDQVRDTLPQPQREPGSGVTLTVRSGGKTTTETMQSVVAPSGYGHVGRNDLCPCGSGKKFKKCHGK
ncbi:MAG: preprotein translocase subunit SecA [Patescibacteria group bacterium]|jgi:preprotein translocase subunit SecA